jgi:hypothetical protein
VHRARVANGRRRHFVRHFAAGNCGFAGQLLLSQWVPFGGGGATIGWTAISVGATLLLGAADIVVLSISWLSTLGLSGSDGLPKQMLRPAQSDRLIAQPDSTREAARRNR